MHCTAELSTGKYIALPSQFNYFSHCAVFVHTHVYIKYCMNRISLSTGISQDLEDF